MTKADKESAVIIFDVDDYVHSTIRQKRFLQKIINRPNQD